MAEPVLDIPIEVMVAPENPSNTQIAHWIRSYEKPFSDKLQEIADKMDAGYTQIVSLEDRTKTVVGESEAKLFKMSVGKSEGNFTGSGMCTIAVASLEQALIVKYGDNVDIEVVHVSTNNMDLGEDEKTASKSMPHYILRFKAKSESEWWTVDPTYRQFQEKVKIGKMVITPSKNEDRIYTFNKFQSGGEGGSSRPVPEVFPKDQLFDRLIMKIAMKDAEMQGITAFDLYQLPQVFLDEPPAK